MKKRPMSTSDPGDHATMSIEPMTIIITGESSLVIIICDVANSEDLIYINDVYDAIWRYLQNSRWIAISMCFSIIAKLDDAISHASPLIGAAKKRIADLFRKLLAK